MTITRHPTASLFQEQKGDTESPLNKEKDMKKRTKNQGSVSVLAVSNLTEAISANNTAVALLKEDRALEALPYLQGAVSYASEHLHEDDPERLAPWINLARAQLGAGQMKEAMQTSIQLAQACRAFAATYAQAHINSECEGTRFEDFEQTASVVGDVEATMQVLRCASIDIFPPPECSHTTDEAVIEMFVGTAGHMLQVLRRYEDGDFIVPAGDEYHGNLYEQAHRCCS